MTAPSTTWLDREKHTSIGATESIDDGRRGLYVPTLLADDHPPSRDDLNCSLAHQGVFQAIGQDGACNERIIRQGWVGAMVLFLALNAQAGLQLGSLKREVFINIVGIAVSDLTGHSRFPSAPDISDSVSIFESRNLGDNYGQRLSGYLIPPESGAYIFYLASDDQSQLWLSTDTNAANKQLIVSEPEWNLERNWQGGAAPWDASLYKSGRASNPITLEAGKSYYVEALHKEGILGDSLAVAWKLPGDVAPANGSEPIGSQFLAHELNRFGGGNPGSLQVTIEPPGAVSAGARWRVNDGALNVSGVTVANLAPGSHTVSFSPATGFAQPDDLFVIVGPEQNVAMSMGYSAAGTGSNPGSSAPVTSAAFGHRVIVPGGTGGYSSGDTWDSAWGADDTLYFQHNDGNGFNNSGYVHDRLTRLSGTPQMPWTLVGQDLNPGVLGSSLNGPCYATGLYEVDGVLYHNVCYSDQTPGAWVFHHTSTMKSTDGGANWINHLGQINVLPPDSGTSCLFPSEEWGQVSFVKYGRGGIAPAVDRAQQYVYLTAGWGQFRLGRVARTNLAKLDRNLFEFYVGGDGVMDSNWTNDIAKAGVVPTPSTSATALVYNDRLGRYLMTSFSSDSWLSPPIESTLRVMEAPHPWGPWTLVLEENVNHREQDNLTWAYLVPKFTSDDGKKMWLSTSGRAPYGLQFIPVYLSTEPVQVQEAETVEVTGGAIAATKAGFSGSGYIESLDTPGDECAFTFGVATAGLYVIQFRYNTTAYSDFRLRVNSQPRDLLLLGRSEQVYATWTSGSVLTLLEPGVNRIALRRESGPTEVRLDHLSISFWAGNSVPGLKSKVAESEMKVSFDTVPGVNYGVDWISNLGDAAGWQVVTNFAGSGNSVELNRPTSEPQGFFRIQTSP